MPLLLVRLIRLVILVRANVYLFFEVLSFIFAQKEKYFIASSLQILGYTLLVIIIVIVMVIVIRLFMNKGFRLKIGFSIFHFSLC